MKERLTGAIIVVAALVLLVPELLTGPSPKTGTQPENAESGPMRSYTIDLADDSAGRSNSAAPTSAAPTAVTEDPVATVKADEAGESATGSDDAATEPAPGSEGAANEVAPQSEAAFVASPGASAASESASGNTPAGGKPGSGESAEPEQPRSAFGPNAARPAARQGGDRRGEAPPRSEPTPSKGWAVQLGVFASRDNAERLAKQVKGKGYPVIVNETSGAKHLYRVRVGPEKDRAGADALNARLRAAGHGGTVVAVP